MFQYRLSTILLIFFLTAATMALFGAWGIWIAGVLFLAGLCINRANELVHGVLLSCLFFFGIVCSGIGLRFAFLDSRAVQRIGCELNLMQIGFALHNYHDAKGCFPSVYTCDKDGKPLFSWIVPLLPNIENDSIYRLLKKDEPWNSPQNMLVLGQNPVKMCQCPSAPHGDNDFTMNYIAIVGPGTIWRNERTVKLSDLPDGDSHTVTLVEVADSSKHWAEPFALTVDEVLENMRTGKGVRISSYHPAGVHVVFANGIVRYFPTKMPLSLWRKILAGDVPAKDLDNIEAQIDPNAPDMVDVYVGNPDSKPWTIILGGIIWLSSVILLFHRAVKSRKKPEILDVNQATPVGS